MSEALVIKRKDYENYLNTFDSEELNLATENAIAKPGSWMRINDPIQFNVGYNEYCQARYRRRRHET